MTKSALADIGCPDLDIALCTACPLPLCRYDEGFTEAMLLTRRNEAIRAAVQRRTQAAVAQDFGLSRRQVLRILKRKGARDG